MVRPSSYTLTDPQHLAANREGHLSGEQMRLLRHDLWRRRTFRLLLYLIGLPLVTFAFAGAVLAVDPAGAKDLVPALFFVTSGTGTVWVILTQVLPMVQTVRDLLADRVERDAGVVTWVRGRWMAEQRGHGTRRRLELLISEAPVPGPYTLYIAAHSRRVLSVEAEVGEGARPTAALTRVLSEVLETEEEDLRGMMAGRLQARGRRRILRMIALRLLGVVGLGLWLWLDWQRLQLEPLWLAIVAGACALAALYLVSRIRRLAEDLREGGVIGAAGMVRKAYRPSSLVALIPERLLIVDGSQASIFSIDSRVFSAVVAGLEYRVYYTPRARVVVGIEVVDDFV